MSYTEICDKFDIVQEHMEKSSKTLTSICSFFKQYSSILDIFSDSLINLEASFQQSLPKEGTMDTLSMSICSLSSHVKKIINSTNTFARNMQLDIIEPLEQFTEQFQQTSINEMRKGISIAKELQKAREQMEKIRYQYYSTSSLAEKANKKVRTLSSDDADQELKENAQRDLIYHRDHVSQECKYYMQAVSATNEIWTKYDKSMPNIMESLQQSDESKIHFIKSSLERYVKHYQKHQNYCVDIIEEVNSIVGNINSNIDIMVFVDSNKSKDSGPNREEFISYEDWSKRRNEVFLKANNEALNTENPDFEHVLKVVNFLIPESEEEKDPEADNFESDFLRFSRILGTVEGRTSFFDILDTKRHKGELSNEKIEKLSQFLKEALTGIIHENSQDAVEFIRILIFSRSFYTIDNNQKRAYLSSYIDHQIFLDRARWSQAMDYAIADRLESNKEAIEKNRSKIRDSGILGTLKQIANKIPFQKDPELERAEKSAAFTIISQYSNHMIRLGVPLEMANCIILNLSKKYNMDYERTCLLLSEIQANQKSLKILSKMKKDSLKRLNKWGNLLPIALSLDWLIPEDTIIVLQVCKAWKMAFRNRIEKRLLIKSSLKFDKRMELRNKIWIDSLKTGSSSIIYNVFLSRGNQMDGKSGMNDVIEMDVLRSFQNNPIVTQDILRRLLRAYAAFNPEVGYCQGMNFIAGTLYLQLKDEEIVFKCLIGLIEKYQMKALFKHNLPKLRQFFYQLDRLIGLLLPEVHEILNEIGINSAHFSSSWFLTLFASILQSKTDILLAIWDLFILEGWKAIFKCAITILKRVSVAIKETRFEEVMLLVTTISQPTCPIQIFDENFIRDVNDTKISSALLDELETEYEELRIKAINKHK